MASTSPLKLICGSLFLLIISGTSVSLPIHSYGEMTATWSQKRCVFPAFSLFVEEPGSNSAVLQSCERPDHEFLEVLCSTFYTVSLWLCQQNNSAVIGNLQANVLETLVNDPQWDVCSSAYRLGTSSLLGFMYNTNNQDQCAKECQHNPRVAPICRWLIAALVKYSESVAATSNANENKKPEVKHTDGDTSASKESTLGGSNQGVTQTPQPPLDKSGKEDLAKGLKPVTVTKVDNSPLSLQGNKTEAAMQTNFSPQKTVQDQGSDVPPVPTSNIKSNLPPVLDNNSKTAGEGAGKDTVAQPPAGISALKGPDQEIPQLKTSQQTDPDASGKQKENSSPGLGGSKPTSALGSNLEVESSSTPLPLQEGVKAEKSDKKEPDEQEHKGNLNGDPNAPPGESEKTVKHVQTNAPVGQTVAPKAQTNAPVGQTVAPKAQKNTPGGQTVAPKDQTSTPGGQTVAQKDQKNAPGGLTVAPKDHKNVSEDQTTRQNDQAPATPMKANQDAVKNEDTDQDDENGDLTGWQDNEDAKVPPSEVVEEVQHIYQTSEDEPPSGHFMAYFVTAVVLCVAGYVIYHNKQKIFAFVLEGRRDTQLRRRASGGGSSGGSSAKYHKLKPSVEEVMPSLEKSTTSTNYIY